MSTFRTHTLGCKVNQYETEYVREGLLRLGYRDAIEDEPADLCVVNTCTVTATGDSKSRKEIRRLARENPESKIVVMGCYATRRPNEVAELPQVTQIITEKRKLPDFLKSLGATKTPDGISTFSGRHRAFVKVQDGCILRCSFCIIPQVRPGLQSRPPEAIVAEVQRLVAAGHREVVLTGIHLGHYGVDFNRGKPKRDWVRLSHLVRTIAQLPGDFRIRLSSLEGTEVTHELLEVLNEYPEKVCPHLHICLQSGSERIAQNMKRRWGANRVIDRCLMVREKLDRPAISTDVIVGFPGESDEDFELTRAAARKVGFAKIHIFPFSPREDTPAARMSDTVPAHVKKARVDELAQVEHDTRKVYFGSLRGIELQVLVERGNGNEMMQGTACRYAPTKISQPSHARTGELIRATAHTWDGEHLTAVPATWCG